MTRVLVCGGREYVDGDRVWRELNSEHKQEQITKIIHGNAGKERGGYIICGADRYADAWAIANRIDRAVYAILDNYWKEFGKIIGPIRNQIMLDREAPNKVIAFPGGRGTADMIRRAKAAGVPVREVGG